jgi:hypothetical protein
MEGDTLKMHRRARMALWQLEPDEQARVRERLAMLANLPRSEWPADVATRLSSGPLDFVVRVDDDWRLFIGQDTDGRAEVQDIVRQGTLDAMAEAARKSGC